MDPYSLLKKKRDGHELTTDEIDYFIRHYTDGSIPDYQMSAFLMAVWFEGLTSRERADLTESMVDTGERFTFSVPGSSIVDKHSTGGVGDGVSLSLVPLAISMGLKVPMMSGRGLGHTGGTLDKLESVPGIHLEYSRNQIESALEEVGGLIMSSTGDVAPADRKMYSLRDVTATIDSIDLIASSIMSKKIAEGTDSLVLDVKTGSGAFIEEYDSSVELARAMVEIGDELGLSIEAYITNMNQPLGEAVGNAVELKQHIRIMKGDGPEDLTELICRLVSSMTYLSGQMKDRRKGYEQARQKLSNGDALSAFRRMIEWQGGTPEVTEDFSLLPEASQVFTIEAEQDGFLSSLDAYEIGMAAKNLGAGRDQKGDRIDHSAGVLLEKKVGAEVTQGDVLMRGLHDQVEEIDTVKNRLKRSFSISNQEPDPGPLVMSKIDQEGSLERLNIR